MRHTHPPHQDPGVQPERTILAWDRTLLLLVTAAAFSLRWLNYHGVLVMVLFAASLVTAAVLALGQRHRYRSASAGIVAERLNPPVASAVGLTLACLGLGVIGLLIVTLVRP
ncbi:DUF202 domain-containing protein [Nesterenkonia alba]|uniref:DUF202 domain-containing protein n=1 Tax=Nesterenkonia alba TaxID=515814 RepID=UPI0003B53E29|nr:DUF202 domain-containing protein [Nesterenkonia alba]